VSIRICVVGDCGVGKSTLAARLCEDDEAPNRRHHKHNVNLNSALNAVMDSGSSSSSSSSGSVLANAPNAQQLPLSLYSPTVGCHTHIKLLRDPVNAESEYFVELLDIGGNPRYLSSLSGNRANSVSSYAY
jgi:GTPase SAR1 family protein